mgnify:FL=1
MTNSSELTVADFLDWAIKRSSKTQREIAREVGYPKPNVVSMMKTGDTKLPLDKIPLFAEALDIDAAMLLRLALAEYHPEAYRVIVDAIGKPLSANERAMVEVYRRAAPLDDVEIDRDLQDEIRELLESKRFGRVMSGR